MDVIPRGARPSGRWMIGSGIPSCAISIACACLSWCGANRRRTPASPASLRSSPRAAVADHPRPRVGPARMQNRGPIASHTRCSVQRAEVLPPPVVHADHPSLPALAGPDQHRSGLRIQIGLGQRECLADPQPRAPQDRDQTTSPVRVWAGPLGASRGLSPKPSADRPGNALLWWAARTPPNAPASPLATAVHR